MERVTERVATYAPRVDPLDRITKINMEPVKRVTETAVS